LLESESRQGAISAKTYQQSMKRKELHALFNEVSSRVSPVRGIYQTGSTERERRIVEEMEKYLEEHLARLEKDAIKRLFLSSLDEVDSEPTLLQWYDALTRHFSHDSIPDEVYIRLMAVVSQNNFSTAQKLIKNHKQENL
jgi:uncharacterized membrane-anchored protein YjiN (DUF445 family)